MVVDRVVNFKLLGVILSDNLKWDDHVLMICAKCSSRLYFLKHLKRACVDTKDLIFFYITMIRPVLEYASPVWHSSLTKKLRDKIESQQVRALRIIFGNFSYPQLLTLAELPSLHERREILGKKFFNNIIKPDNCLYHLIPPRRCSPVIIKLRVTNVLPISKCRTERFKNSYIPYALSHYQI